MRKLVPALPVLCLLGCAADPQRELEDVAKRWCETIRASQIIPVYPPNRDLLPGDVFLVNITADDQHTIYRKKGYLPFDKHLLRLTPDYGAFYLGPEGKRYAASCADDWQDAPMASFPSYSFDVSKKSGLKLAVPIEAVKVGLDMSGRNEATASVSIQDVRNCGVTIEDLLPKVADWAQTPEGHRILSSYPPVCGKHGDCSYTYLRVVDRVYRAKSLDVSIASSESFDSGLGASVGAGGASVAGIANAIPKHLTALEGAVDQRARVLNALNRTTPGGKSLAGKTVDDATDRLGKVLDQAKATGARSIPVGDVVKPVDDLTRLLPTLELAEGRVQFTSFSRNSISMRETWDDRLGVGYVGFDLPILKNGTLGAPVTIAVLALGNAEEQPAMLNQVAYDYDELLHRIAAGKDAAKADQTLTRAISALGQETGDARFGEKWEAARNRRTSSSGSAAAFKSVIIALTAPPHPVTTLDRAGAALARALSGS